MQVSFNPVMQNYKNPSFMASKKSAGAQFSGYTQPTKDEIITARTKKTISECKYVVFGLGILYFAMKRNIKVNKIKAAERKMVELAKQKVPKPQLMNINVENLMP